MATCIPIVTAYNEWKVHAPRSSQRLFYPVLYVVDSRQKKTKDLHVLFNNKLIVQGGELEESLTDIFSNSKGKITIRDGQNIDATIGDIKMDLRFPHVIIDGPVITKPRSGYFISGMLSDPHEYAETICSEPMMRGVLQRYVGDIYKQMKDHNPAHLVRNGLRGLQ